MDSYRPEVNYGDQKKRELRVRMSPRNGLAPSLHGFSLPVFGRFFAAQAAFVSLQMGGKPRWVAQIGALGQTHIFRNLGGVCTMGRNVWTLVLGQHFFRGLNETVIL